MVKSFRQKFRIFVQMGFTAVTNGYAAGFVNGTLYKGDTKFLCVPGLNCYSCPGALGSCPIGSLQAVLSDRNHKFSFYILGFLMVFGALLGRFVCGWLCPFGLVQDLIHRIPVPRTRGNRAFGAFQKRKTLPGHRFLKWLKYAILLGFVIILPLTILDIVGQGQPWFCKYICPSGTLFAGIPMIASHPELRSALGWLFTWKFAILIVLLILSFFVYRPFCQYLCPLGAVYGLFNPVALVKLRIDEEACTKCQACRRACPLDIDVWKNPNSPVCIRCGRCKDACPHGAIH